MTVNIEVEKNKQESTANLMRRFTKRVQGAGIIPRIRKNRYYARTKSPAVVRMTKLKKLAGQKKYEELIKLGKIQERQPRRRRR